MATPRKKPHLITIRGTMETDKALGTLAELLGKSKADTLVCVISHYLETVVNTPEFDKTIAEKKEELSRLINAAKDP